MCEYLESLHKILSHFTHFHLITPSSSSGNSYELVTAKSEITIRQLLNHTSGITYHFWAPEDIKDLYHEAEITDENNNRHQSISCLHV